MLFHLDAVEFRGQREVVRVVMFMKQTRNLHVFHMPDLLKPPVHRVVPLVGVRPSVQHSFFSIIFISFSIRKLLCFGGLTIPIILI